MSQVDDAFFFAEPLSPDDRLRLIARLWASLPPNHWAAPSPAELAELHRRLADHAAGQTADVPWEIVNRMLVNREAAKRGRIYSAPRRFDLYTIMIVTAAYAVLLGGMSALRFPPVVSGYVAGFITLVGIGQAILFGGRWPRLASGVSGMVAYFIGTVSFPGLVGRFHIGGTGELIAFAMIFAVLFGSILGYIAGVLVGGVFLIADTIRASFSPMAGDGATTVAFDRAPRSPKNATDSPAPPHS